MAKKKTKPARAKKAIDKERLNNPPVGLVTPATDPPDPPKKTSIPLVWSGMARWTRTHD